MSKLLIRDSLPHREWQEYDSGHYDFADMERRLVSREEDCGFVGEMMSQLYGSSGIEVQVWDSELYSNSCGVLVIEATWSYPHSNHLNTRTLIRVMEGEL